MMELVRTTRPRGPNATIQSAPLLTNKSRSDGSIPKPRGSAIRSSSLNGPINFPCGLNAKIFPSPEPLLPEALVTRRDIDQCFLVLRWMIRRHFPDKPDDPKNN